MNQCTEWNFSRCLLGHKVRKVEDTENRYDAYMEEARKLYEDKGSDFETNPLSEVIYLNSFTPLSFREESTR